MIFSLIGAIIIVIGLYSVVWGKSKDQNITSEKVAAQELPVVCDNLNKLNGNYIDDIIGEPAGKSNNAVNKYQREDP